jgi:hypothetical protein
MSVTASDITSRYSQFSSVPTTTINLFIEDATLEINASAWGNKTDLATIYLTCHNMAMAGLESGSGAGGSGGTITKKKVGDLEKTFASPTSSSSTKGDEDLSNTPYGRAYLRLRRGLVKTPIVINHNMDFNS